MATAEQVLLVAKGQMGYKEEPWGSNRTKYGRWWGVNPGAWCAMFVMWCMDQAGMPTRQISGGASVGQLRNYMQSHLRMINNPVPGCLVFFEWENDTWPDHIGFVESVNADGTINTIEGNSPGPDRTDEVARHHRTRKVARWFAIPEYSAAVTIVPPAIPITGITNKISEDITVNETVVEMGFDQNGNGWLQLGIPHEKIISVKFNGAFPPVDGYWHNPIWASQARGGNAILSAIQGPPNGKVLVWVYSRP